MPMPTSSPHARLHLLLAALLLLAGYASSSALAAGDSFSLGGGKMEMVAVHAGTTAGVRTAGAGNDSARSDSRVSTAAASAPTTRRRLEDEVAPEFPSAAVRGQPSGIGYQSIYFPQQFVCLSRTGCAGKPAGSSYTRGCTYKQLCSH